MNQQTINIDITKTDEIKCAHCESITFRQVYFLRKLSAILSPTGKEETIPVQAFECSHCRKVKLDNELPQKKKFFM